MEMFSGGSINSFISATAFVWAAFLVLIMIGIAYYFKKKEKKRNLSEKIFIILYINNMIMIFLEFILYFVMRMSDCFIKTLLCRSYFLFGFMLCFLLILYLVTYLYEINKKEVNRKIFYVFIALCIIFAVCSSILPYDVEMEVYGKYYVQAGFLNSLYNYLAIFLNLVFFIIMIIYHDKLPKTFFYLSLFVFLTYLANYALERIVGYNVKDSIFIYSLLVLSLFNTIANQDKKLLNNLNEAKTNSEKLNHDRNLIVYKFSHEIRSYLNDIVLNSDSLILNQNINNNELSSNCTSITNSYIELSNYNDNILSLIRIQNNEELININKFDLNTLINDINSYIQPIIKFNNLSFNLNYNNNLNSMYSCDYNKLKKIIINLIFNSIISGNNSINLTIVEKKINESINELSFIVNSNNSINLLNLDLSNLINSNVNIDSSLLCIILANSYSKLLNGNLSFSNNNFVFKFNLNHL